MRSLDRRWIWSGPDARVRWIAQDLSISDQTVCSEREQDLIDKIQASGTASGEQAELLVARSRIREPEPNWRSPSAASTSRSLRLTRPDNRAAGVIGLDSYSPVAERRALAAQ